MGTPAGAALVSVRRDSSEALLMFESGVNTERYSAIPFDAPDAPSTILGPLSTNLHR